MMKLKKYRSMILSSLILMLFAHPASAAKNLAPIKILTLDWTSQIVLSKITGRILGNLGYNVEYVPVESRGQWYMLFTKKGHVQMEVWEGTMAKKFNELVEQGKIVDAGSHSAKTREEWWYPSYIEEDCPGLPSWEALRDCKELFAVSETAPDGRYVGGPWEKPDEARIRALDLGFKVIKASTGDDIWVELEKAAEKKLPVVLFNWTPNWVEAVYDGKFIEFPEYDPKCETEPEWGVNQKFTWDCGNPKDGWLKKMVATNFSDDWPCANTIINNIDFTNLMVAEVTASVDVNGMTQDDAAREWVLENETKWRRWIPTDCSA